MTADEFARWIESHADTFGEGCCKYLEAASAYEAWQHILGGFDVQDATAATRALLAGDLGEWRAFNEHPRIIRAFCTQRKAERNRVAKAAPGSYRSSYRCLVCRDVGYVTVWSARSIADVLNEREVYLAASAMPCYCDLGKTKLRTGGRVYDAAVDPVPNTSKPLGEGVDALREFLASAKKPQRPGYSEFHDYVGQP